MMVKYTLSSSRLSMHAILGTKTCRVYQPEMPPMPESIDHEGTYSSKLTWNDCVYYLSHALPLLFLLDSVELRWSFSRVVLLGPYLLTYTPLQHIPLYSIKLFTSFFSKKYIKLFTFYITLFTIQIKKSLQNKFFHFSILFFHFPISIIYLFNYFLICKQCGTIQCNGSWENVLVFNKHPLDFIL